MYQVVAIQLVRLVSRHTCRDMGKRDRPSSEGELKSQQDCLCRSSPHLTMWYAVTGLLDVRAELLEPFLEIPDLVSLGSVNHQTRREYYSLACFLATSGLSPLLRKVRTWGRSSGLVKVMVSRQSDMYKRHIPPWRFHDLT